MASSLYFNKDFRVGNQTAFLTAFDAHKRLLTAEKHSNIKGGIRFPALSQDQPSIYFH
jgi:hypothetical protein